MSRPDEGREDLLGRVVGGAAGSPLLAAVVVLLLVLALGFLVAGLLVLL
jgi:hypothetical protein